MPVFRKKAEEDTDPELRVPDTHLRPPRLTKELLDWLIAASEAVLKATSLTNLADRRAVVKEKRAVENIKAALKTADDLYPLTVEPGPEGDTDAT